MAGPKPFNDTLVQLRYGALHDELTDKINEVVTAVDRTQKAGKLTLTLAFKPGKGGQIEIVDDIKATLPKEEKGASIMFATPEGNLQREDPRQKTFEGIRSVDAEIQARKTGTHDAPLSERHPKA
jgi:hypothetical protein